MLTLLTMKTAILYCRVSSDSQVKEGHGLEGQETNCRRFAEAKGYSVVSVFKDEAVSGGNIERDGMDALLNFLEANKGSSDFVVIVDDIKRIARDVVAHFHIRKQITSLGATIESPIHTFDETPEGKFMETLLAAGAEYERNDNKRRVVSRMKARLERGYWPFFPPSGYKQESVEGHGKLLVPTEPEATIIRKALEGFASGKFASQTDVQQFLASKKFSPPQCKGKTYLEQVKRLLIHEAYAGLISYPKWNVSQRKGHHQALISLETHDRILERLQESAKAPRTDTREDFPLRGFMLCSSCRHPYTSSWCKGRNDRYPYYRCMKKGCPFYNKSVKADEVHKKFVKLLAVLKPRKNILAVVKADLLAEWNQRLLTVENVRKERQQKIKDLEDRMKELIDKIEHSKSPTVIEELELRVEAMKAKKIRLGGKVSAPKKQYDFETALNRSFDFIKNPLQKWKKGDLKQRQLVLRFIFEDALVYSKETGFETAKLSLPVKISCVPELDRLELVEMPGVEPGSNVYIEGPYDHVLLNSLRP